MRHVHLVCEDQHGQQGHHGGGDSLSCRHQIFGLQPVGKNSPGQVEDQGRNGDGHSQEGQIQDLTGYFVQQPTQGELKQHLVACSTGQQC